MDLRNFLSFSRKIHVRKFSKITLKKVIYKNAAMNLLIAGANSHAGRMSAMLFKLEKEFKKMHLYDNVDVSNIAKDLSMINKGPIINSFCGAKNLEAALKGIRIVYICGGIQTCPGLSEMDLFDKNVPWVRQVITYCAEFCPKAMVVIATPPTSFLVPMAIEEFRKSDVCADTRVFGVVNTYVSRANYVVGEHEKSAPATINAYVVGGTHRKTCIPVLSHTKTGSSASDKMEKVVKNIQEAEEFALHQKLKEKNKDGCYLSSAYNGVKFTMQLVKALNGATSTACAFVKQPKPMDEYTKYLTCLIELDKNGLKSCNIPVMSQDEKNRLKLVMNEIRNNIYLGSSYVTGEDIIIVRKMEKPPVKEKKIVEEKPPTKKDVCKKIQPPKTLQIPVKVKKPCEC